MLQCPAGTYANETGQEQCQPCPEGYECPTASHQPSVCRRGTYSSGGVSACSPCPTGMFANYTGAVECESCPAGYACQVASNRPMACSAGTFRYVLNAYYCAAPPPTAYCFLSALWIPVYVHPVHLVIILLPSLKAVSRALLVCSLLCMMFVSVKTVHNTIFQVSFVQILQYLHMIVFLGLILWAMLRAV